MSQITQKQKDLDMDGVLTDISGLMTDRFYTYLTGYNKDAVVCCFKLGASIENTIPKQLLKFFWRKC